MPPAVEVQRLNHWATREFQERCFTAENDISIPTLKEFYCLVSGGKY